MLKKLIPIVIVILGAGGGIAAGMFLRPAPEATEGEHAEKADHAEDAEHADPEHLPEYVKFSNQFVIPVIEKGEVTAMVVLSLSLEVEPGATDRIFASEPKLRDAMLQVLFEHSNAGGFRGSFTDGANLVLLREALMEVATKAVPELIRDVLITEIVRQDA